MSGSKKGIVVLDEVPSLCINCPFFQIDSNGTDIACVIGNGFLDRKKWGKEKPKWCPICEVNASDLEGIPKGGQDK